MDFTNRGIRPQQTNSSSNEQASEPVHPQSSKPKGRLARIRNHKLLNITYVGLLFSITILIVGVVCAIFFFDGGKNRESKLVDTSKYQAVFLNNGQVYFGKINDLNSRFLSLSNIYYLQVNQTVQPDDKTAKNNNFTLTKLGCELHRPQDVMVINRDQITFWENLKDETDQNTISGGIKKQIELTGGKQDCTQKTQTNNNTDGSSPSNNTTSNSSNSTNNSTNNSSTTENSTSNNSNNQ